MLYKKCRIKWIPDGDANTIFSMLWLIGEEEQTAKGLPINGCWVKEPEKVKEKGSNFFAIGSGKKEINGLTWKEFN